MKKYIDAYKLIDMIGNSIAYCQINYSDDYALGFEHSLREVKGFINFLQQEQPHKSFCEENCKGYRDTGGKCFFDFNCSVKKAQEQPEADLEKELKNLIKNSDNGCSNLDIARHFYELGLNAAIQTGK